MFDKVVHSCCFVFGSIADQYKTQEMCDWFIYEDPFMLLYLPDRYKTQRIYDEAAYECLGALEFILDWFVTNKMLEKFHDALLPNVDIIFY